jgi:hypothetical protein
VVVAVVPWVPVSAVVPGPSIIEFRWVVVVVVVLAGVWSAQETIVPSAQIARAGASNFIFFML